jgi:hypothetical protein
MAFNLSFIEQQHLLGNTSFRPKMFVGYVWTSPFVFTKFVDSLIALERPEGWDVKIVRGDGWSPARRHTHVVEQGLAWGADVIGIIGSDQVYDPDLLCRLAKRFEDGYTAVAAMVPSRGYIPSQKMLPFQPLAWRWKSPEEMGISPQELRARTFRSLKEDGDMVHVVTRADGEMVPVDFIGSGVLFFHKDHVLAMQQPWFYESVNTATQARLASQDTRFVWRLKTEGGARLHVDTTIVVKHLHIFEIDDTFSERFQDWAVPGPHRDSAIIDTANDPAQRHLFVNTNASAMRVT